MSKRITVALALIARNEEIGLQAVGPQIPFALFDELIGVDGNSSDNTLAELESFGIKAFRQRERGLGRR